MSRLKILLGSFVAQSCVIPVHLHSLVPCLAVTTPPSSLVLLRLFVGQIISFPAELVYAFCLTPNTRPVSPLALPTLKGTCRWPRSNSSSKTAKAAAQQQQQQQKQQQKQQQSITSHSSSKPAAKLQQQPLNISNNSSKNRSSK